MRVTVAAVTQLVFRPCHCPIHHLKSLFLRYEHSSASVQVEDKGEKTTKRGQESTRYSV